MNSRVGVVLFKGTLAMEISLCRNGHPKTPENLYVRKDGYTMCRPCMKATDDRRRERERNSKDKKNALR